MKKATKLLTVVAMAATLILGAGAFVSCSNSSDSSSSTPSAEDQYNALYASIKSMATDYSEKGYQKITVDNVKSWIAEDDEYEELSEVANTFNTAVQKVNSLLDVLNKYGNEDDEPEAEEEEEDDWDKALEGIKEVHEQTVETFGKVGEAFADLSEVEKKAATLGKNSDDILEDEE